MRLNSEMRWNWRRGDGRLAGWPTGKRGKDAIIAWNAEKAASGPNAKQGRCRSQSSDCSLAARFGEQVVSESR